MTAPVLPVILSACHVLGWPQRRTAPEGTTMRLERLPRPAAAAGAVPVLQAGTTHSTAAQVSGAGRKVRRLNGWCRPGGMYPFSLELLAMAMLRVARFGQPGALRACANAVILGLRPVSDMDARACFNPRLQARHRHHIRHSIPRCRPRSLWSYEYTSGPGVHMCGLGRC